MKTELIKSNGSVQSIRGIPDDLREVFTKNELINFDEQFDNRQQMNQNANHNIPICIALIQFHFSFCQQLYKTCWEIKQKAILDMAADRGAYIDQ